MKEKSVLFQIKELDKNIIKSVIPKDKCIMNKTHNPTQMRVIGYILKNMDKDIYQKDLENYLKISRATLSDLLHRMEKNGLIKRDINPNDIRSKKIELTSSAISSYNEGKKKLISVEEKISKDLTEEELEIFFNITNKMIKNINEDDYE